MADENFVLDIHGDLAEMQIDEGIDEPDNIDKRIVDFIHNQYVYVDIQGFKKPKNRFICKEFCLIDNDGYKFHAFVKPTISFKKLPNVYKRQAIWLMNNHHKIDYDFGDTDSFDLRDQMYPKLRNKIVLVKGMEKVKWLQYMFRLHGGIVCLDIDSMDFDMTLKQSDPYDICNHHNRIFGWTQGPCAMSTALMIQDLAHKNTNKLN